MAFIFWYFQLKKKLYIYIYKKKFRWREATSYHSQGKPHSLGDLHWIYRSSIKEEYWQQDSNLRACLDNKKSSLNFRHSISVTHHSSLITHHSSLIFSHSFGNIIFIFITQFFHTIHGSHTCQSIQCFFFFQYPTHRS